MDRLEESLLRPDSDSDILIASYVTDECPQQSTAYFRQMLRGINGSGINRGKAEGGGR